MTVPGSTYPVTYVLSTSSVRLGTANSHPACSYKYHALNALTFARTFASFRLDPCPSPNFSLPEYTPTTNTGTRVCRPDSAMRRDMGRGILSRSHRRVSSCAGDWERCNDDNGGSVRERICALINVLATLRPCRLVYQTNRGLYRVNIDSSNQGLHKPLCSI